MAALPAAVMSMVCLRTNNIPGIVGWEHNMGKRGPTPAGAKKAVVLAMAESSFFPAPEEMSAEAIQLWNRIVAAYPQGYFQSGDVPLLQAYCDEYVRRNHAERRLAEQGEVIETATGAVKRNPWHEVLVSSNNTLSQLATKLRLCVNSRISGKAAGKIEEKPKPKRAGLMFGA